MKGMDVVVALRREGKKPSSVFVYLVDTVDVRQPALSDKGIVSVEIARHENLSDIDFRPLHGLYVLLCDVAGDGKRYRRLGRLVAQVEPAKLVMPIGEGDDYRVHRREGGLTKTFTL